MAKIFVTSTARSTPKAPHALSEYRRVLLAARHDRVGRHELVDRAERADMILFVGSRSRFHFDVLEHPAYRNAPERCFVLDSSDGTIVRIPGIYMAIPRALHGCPVYRYGFYMRIFENRVLDEAAPYRCCEFLYSFTGRVQNCPGVRQRVMDLAGPRALLQDRSTGQSDEDPDYARGIARSKFVICPRGFGPSSWRIFETMRTGRVPVVVSDAWVPPRGPQWEEFSLHIRESEIEQIPERLEQIEHLAERMGRKAHEAWSTHFGLHGAFNWIADTLESIRELRTEYEPVVRRWPIRELLHDPVDGRRFIQEYSRALFSQSANRATPSPRKFPGQPRQHACKVPRVGILRTDSISQAPLVINSSPPPNSAKESCLAPLVSVLVTAFNHEHFIGQCLDSILAQRTAFAFEIIVIDDGSSDGTAQSIKKYARQFPGIVKPVLLRFNHRSKCLPVYSRIYRQASGSFIAGCDGDDYWSDPQKLQKQVDFLVGHPEFVLSFHDAVTLSHQGQLATAGFLPESIKRDFTPDEILRDRLWTFVGTLMYRKVVAQLPREFDHVPNRDHFLPLILAAYGAARFQPEVGHLVYRLHASSYWSSSNPARRRYMLMRTKLMTNLYLVRTGRAGEVAREYINRARNKWNRVMARD